MPIKVLIVTDRWVVSAGLRAALSEQNGIEVVGEACTVTDAAALADSLKADVAIICLRDPLHAGVYAFSDSRCRAIVIVPCADEETILSLVMEGAAGYLSEDVEGEALVSAVRAAYEGGAPVDPQVANVVTRHLRDRLLVNESAWLLTVDELEILRRIVRGQTNRQIGCFLHLADREVKVRVSSILRKVGAKNRIAAAAWWARYSELGATQPDSQHASDDPPPRGGH